MRKVLLDRRLKKVGPVGFLETHWLIVGLGLRRDRPGGTILTLPAIIPARCPQGRSQKIRSA